MYKTSIRLKLSDYLDKYLYIPCNIYCTHPWSHITCQKYKPTRWYVSKTLLCKTSCRWLTSKTWHVLKTKFVKFHVDDQPLGQTVLVDNCFRCLSRHKTQATARKEKRKEKIIPSLPKRRKKALQIFSHILIFKKWLFAIYPILDRHSYQVLVLRHRGYQKKKNKSWKRRKTAPLKSNRKHSENHNFIPHPVLQET